MRYVAIPKRPRSGDYFDEGPLLEGRTVYVSDEPVDTGLLDATGTKLYRVDERVRAGFQVTK